MIFVLQYKLVRDGEKVHDYSFQITPESLRKTHKIVLKYIDCGWGYDEEREAHFEMKFNKKSSVAHQINTMDDIDSIIVSASYNSTGLTSDWVIQYAWKEELEKLVKKLN